MGIVISKKFKELNLRWMLKTGFGDRDKGTADNVYKEGAVDKAAKLVDLIT